MSDAATRRRIEVAPRPSPLIEVSMANADEFLADGDFGLSVGEGHFPARVIQQITGSPYVHVIGIQRGALGWYLIESAPPRVRVRRLDECVSEYSGLVDFYRLAPPDLCDLEKAWDWALRAEDTPYSYFDLWLVWRRRFKKAVAEGRIQTFDFPDPPAECGCSDECVMRLRLESQSFRVPNPKPNSDLPDGCRRDCSSFWRAAARVNWIGPPEKLIAAEQKYDGDCVPGDFADLEYICTLVDPKTTPRAT